MLVRQVELMVKAGRIPAPPTSESNAALEAIRTHGESLTMSRKRSPAKPDDATDDRVKVLKPDVFGSVQNAFLTILKRRDVGTVDLIHEILDIDPGGRPAIGRAIADLARQGLIERVDFRNTQRAVAHGRFVSLWRLKR